MPSRDKDSPKVNLLNLTNIKGKRDLNDLKDFSAKQTPEEKEYNRSIN